MRLFQAGIFICFYLFSFGSNAQDFSSLWEGHFSYLDVKDVSRDTNKLYVAAENAIFTYDFNSAELSTISTIEGLSGETISNIHYSAQYQLLIIGYDNGLMEIVSSDNDVLTIIDIIDKPTIPPNNKRINHFNEHEGVLYISTDFGITIYDLERLEFGDTYFIGNGGSQIKISQTTIFNDRIYAACLSGNAIKWAEVSNPNLIDYQQWQTINSGDFLAVQSVNDKLYAVKSNNVLYEVVNNSIVSRITYPLTPVDVRTSNSQLVVATKAKVYLYDSNLSLIGSVDSSTEFVADFTCATINEADELFIGTKSIQINGKPGKGVLKTTLSNPSEFEELHPDGPLANNMFSIETISNELWAVFGGYSFTFNPSGGVQKSGTSHYKNDAWINKPYDTIAAVIPNPFNLSHIAINPFDPNNVFISSYLTGLIEYRDEEPFILYDENNSTLFPFTSNVHFVSASEFDRNGALWLMNGRFSKPLNKFENGQWRSFDFSSIIDPPSDNLGFSDIEITPQGTLFIGSVSNGVIGFNENNGSPLLKFIDSEEQGFPSEYVKTLALDNNNQLWIGTIRGIRVLFNTSNFFDDDSVRVSDIIILEDGIAKELLANQVISDIEVDGSNNKWVGTGTFGVFYFSPDGQETIYHFTTDNSPLPSNVINDIAIDPSDGTVYIATQKGLVAFASGGTSPEETLADAYVYPNPVRPEYNILGSNDLNNINNGIKIKGLTENVNIKITDIEGNLVAEAQSRINQRSSRANYNFAIDGGTAIWNGRNLGNNIVATGVYLMMISDLETFETKVLKVLIVR